MRRRALISCLVAAVLAPACAAADPAEAVAQPSDNPVPFAESAAPVRYWPVVTDDARWARVSFERADGSFAGTELRRFNAPRPSARADNPTRRHVGVDLFAAAGDAVIAVEDGRIVAFYPFLRAATGEMSYALLVSHAGYVANYGEVRATSLSDLGLALGDVVSAGQPIAVVSDTRQLHFETYRAGTTHGQSWGHGAAAPDRVLNPTRLLLDLARSGRRLRPAERAPRAIDTSAAIP
jgi:murein DD-endopeptidase MepM/ murein hydrolase activator NlpD